MSEEKEVTLQQQQAAMIDALRTRWTTKRDELKDIVKDLLEFDVIKDNTEIKDLVYDIINLYDIHIDRTVKVETTVNHIYTINISHGEDLEDHIINNIDFSISDMGVSDSYYTVDRRSIVEIG